jgi:hypothetical protein
MQPGEPTGTIPFKLDNHSKHSPSRFEVTFVTESVRYVFELSLTQDRVIEEYLIAYPKGLPQRWYARNFDQDGGKYVWTTLSSSFKQDLDLQEKTRQNSLFLSVGPQFGHPDLTRVFDWFRSGIRFLSLSADSFVSPGFTSKMFDEQKNPDEILHLLRSADIGITDIDIQKKESNLAELKGFLAPEVFKNLIDRIGDENAVGKSVEIQFGHGGQGENPVYLDFHKEESAGTRRLYSIGGPWIDTLKRGHTILVDEIETSLHPLLVRDLLKLVLSEEHNPKGAQILFTTHNPILLDNTLMRRDQVWFTEKTADGATHLYPLTDYKPRNDEALAKGYLAGRYGAIPYLPEGLKL